MRFGILLSIGLVAAGSAWAAPPQSAEDIRTCMRTNYPNTTSEQNFELQSFDRAGGSRTLNARVYWKRDANGKAKVAMRVYQPEDLSGSSYLLVEKAERDDTFMYLPAVNRVKRIQGNQMSDDLWGTDFSYEDIKQVQGVLSSGKLERLPDEDVSGKKAYLLAVTPQAGQGAAGYEKIMTWIDQQNCVPLKVEFVQSGKVRKRMLVDPAKVSKKGERWIPHHYVITDLLSETRTELRISKIENDRPLADRLFNPQTFYITN